MSRPRQYPCAAAKQAAYRARLQTTTMIVDRGALTRLHEKLDRLREVLSAAAQQGDPLAHQCSAASVDTMLEKTIAAFEKRLAHAPVHGANILSEVGPE